MREQQASILTIGDEVTSGQISNRNSQWMAQQAIELGLQVHAHHSCNDRCDEIVDALSYLSKHAGVICMTGGLGPTTDDLTRDAIAQFVGQPLEFHNESWQRIVDYFRRAGSEPRDTNRQQCFFPKGSQVFPNLHGTADGFFFDDKKTGTKIVVLPGPPRELEPMWHAHVPTYIRPEKANEKLTTWRLVGIGESALQYEIQKLKPPSGRIRLGYRASMPIVEVKVWQSLDQKMQPEDLQFLDHLEELMTPWLFEAHSQDILKTFRDEIIAKHPEICIVDHYTGGQLQRVILQNFEDASEFRFSLCSLFNDFHATSAPHYLKISQKPDSSLIIIDAKVGKQQVHFEIAPPFPAARAKFNQMAIAYLTCKNLLKVLDKHPM